MSITTQSADGVQHQFPDGTDPAVIDRAMKQYAGSKQETAQPIQSGQAPWMESLGNNIGDILGLGTGHGPPKPTGILPLDTLREYPYQAEAGIRSGLAMARHGANALSEGKPSGAVGLGVGGISALGAPLSAAFGPISRPVHDWIGNPVEKATGIPADVVTAGAMALPGVVDVPRLGGAPRINEPAPPRTQIGSHVAGTRAEEQRASVMDNLQNAKAAAYKASEDAGVIVKTDPLKAATDSIHNDLAEYGYEPTAQPNISPILDRLRSATAGDTPITLKGIDTIRKMAVNAAKPSLTHPSQPGAAHIILDHLDNMTTNLAPGDILTPDKTLSAAAINSLYQGRSLAKTQAKADMIDQALTIAKDRADRTGSGANVENTVRQEIGKVLDRVTRKKLKVFTPEEVAQMRMVVRGGNINNLLRYVGKFSPEHPLYAMMAGMGAGSVVGGPLGAGVGTAITGAGWASKLGSEAINRYRANELFNTVARGKPSKQIQTPFEPPSPGPGGGPRGPGPSGPQPPIMPAAPRLPPPNGIRAYHGSPHEFDQFDNAKIRSGEGNTSEGHGFYLDENQQYPRQIHSNLTRPPKGGSEILARRGSIYETNIDAKPSELIDWTKAFADQSPQAKGALNSILGDIAPGANMEETLDAAAQSMGAKNLRSPKLAARLSALGIKGFKVPSGGGNWEQSHTYVIFDGKHLKIVRRIDPYANRAN